MCVGDAEVSFARAVEVYLENASWFYFLDVVSHYFIELLKIGGTDECENPRAVGVAVVVKRGELSWVLPPGG